MGNGLPDVSNSPFVIWAAIIAVLVLAVATITDKGLGPIGRWWFALAQQRRVAAAEKATSADATHERDTKALMTRLTAVEKQVDALLNDQAARDSLAFDHMGWDREARQQVADLGGTLRQPPPLIPTSD